MAVMKEDIYTLGSLDPGGMSCHAVQGPHGEAAERSGGGGSKGTGRLLCDCPRMILGSRVPYFLTCGLRHITDSQ